MRLLVLVLNKVECLDSLLEEWFKNDIRGATILNSRGMAQSLSEHSDIGFFSSLRVLLNPDNKENKTIFMVVEEEKIELVSRIVDDVTGGLENPNTGILFTLPIENVKGMKK